MTSLLHRLRVGGRGWRIAAWVCAAACVLAATAWVWSGWSYLWIGRVTTGVLIDEGQVYVLADRKEWPDVLDIGQDYGERWRPIYSQDGRWTKLGRGGTAQWRWWGRTQVLTSYDAIMPGLVRASCPLWALSLGCGVGAGVCVWMSGRARVRWAGRCERCGYEVRGLRSCPECGRNTEPEGRTAAAESGGA